MDQDQTKTVLVEMVRLLTKVSAATSTMLELTAAADGLMPAAVAEHRQISEEIRQASDSLNAMLRALD